MICQQKNKFTVIIKKSILLSGCRLHLLHHSRYSIVAVYYSDIRLRFPFSRLLSNLTLTVVGFKKVQDILYFERPLLKYPVFSALTWIKIVSESLNNSWSSLGQI